MSSASAVIAIALQQARVIGAGQTPSASNLSIAFTVLNEMILQWNRERAVAGGALAPLPLFATNDATDVPSWTPFEASLVWGLTARLRVAFALPPLPEDQMKLVEATTLALQTQTLAITPQTLSVGQPTTALGIIALALQAAGRITDRGMVTPGSQDVADALALLQSLMALWDQERWLVWNLTELALVSSGAMAYTLGPGLAFSAPRAAQIADAFARYAPGAGTPIDYPLEILESRQDYDRIPFKGLQGLPDRVFFDSGYPYGTLYFYPVPLAGLYELHIFVKTALPSCETLTDQIGLPPEYNLALAWALALQIHALKGTEPTKHLLGLARAALATIRSANFQIPKLRMPAALRQRGGPDWLFGGAGQGGSPVGAPGQFSNQFDAGGFQQ